MYMCMYTCYKYVTITRHICMYYERSEHGNNHPVQCSVYVRTLGTHTYVNGGRKRR